LLLILVRSFFVLRNVSVKSFPSQGPQTWRFGLVANVVGRINEVNQRPARLVLGWVTVVRQVNHLNIKPTKHVNSAWPSLRG